MYSARSPVNIRVRCGKMKQPLLVSLRLGGEGMEQTQMADVKKGCQGK